MAEAKDWQLEAPASLKDIVRDELIACGQEDFRRHKEVKPITDESVEGLMQKVYAHIEKEALAVYHSAEPWALRQWALGNILKEEIVNEVTAEIAHELISPVISWQSEQEFDPIKHFIDQIHDLNPLTIKNYLVTAARFVGFIGRKRYYSDEDITNYLKYARKRFENDNTYHQEGIKLLQFLRNLGDENRKLPGTKKRHLRIRTKYAYSVTQQDMETVALACLIDHVRFDMVLRLVCSTIYGRRAGELVDFKVNLNDNTVLFPTRKGGEQVPHPIPPSLVPLFMVPMYPITEGMLQRWLRQICKKAEVNLPYRSGFHSFRRRVATMVRHEIHSDINTHRFMRWADPREFGILGQYDQARYEDIDKEVLAVHPMVKLWEDLVPILFKFNRSYRPFYDNIFKPFYDNIHI